MSGVELDSKREKSRYHTPQKWTTFFVRGISYDQSGDWIKAKNDFITALELSKDHPEVLNYFGYSLIERNENLEEALKMIESAVSQRPESGYIVDSLAWGLFKLGFYTKYHRDVFIVYIRTGSWELKKTLDPIYSYRYSAN